MPSRAVVRSLRSAALQKGQADRAVFLCRWTSRLKAGLLLAGTSLLYCILKTFNRFSFFKLQFAGHTARSLSSDNNILTLIVIFVAMLLTDSGAGPFVPEPGWVIKVLRVSGEKVFINLCEHAEVTTTPVSLGYVDLGTIPVSSQFCYLT